MSKSQQEMLAVTQMRELAKLPENARCADCDARDPDWTSINLGIFICIKCAGIHRNLGVHHSKVRSIELDTACWDEELIGFMKRMGNEKARHKYEKRAPAFWMRPKEFDLSMVRERWIRAKYEKKLFVGESEENGATSPAVSASFSSACPSASAPSTPSTRRATALARAPPADPALYPAPERATEGWLMKENKHGKWQKRWFTLWGRELHYFKDAGDSYEAGRLDLVHSKILIPDCSGAANSPSAPSGHRYLFQLVSTEQDRCYPLAAESEEELFHWLHAVRRAQIFYTRVAQGPERAGMQPLTPDVKVPFGRLASSVEKRGLLSKQGGGWASWNKRYFVLAGNVLYYYKNQPADADLPEGGIPLEYSDVGDGEDKCKRKLAFTILTPDRTYFLQASSEDEMRDWIATLQAKADACLKRRMVDYADSALK